MPDRITIFQGPHERLAATPDHLADQVVGNSRQALVGALKNGDAVGHGERLEDAARGQGASFIEA